MVKYQIYKALNKVTEIAIDKLYDFQEQLQKLQLEELEKALADVEFSTDTNKLFKKVFG